MKFSIRQIFASAGGAVLAAVIASFFGVKGTIVGVGIGSAAATFGTAFVAQSIDRGQKAVKQVAVRVPDSSTLLRRLGGTGASGVTTQESAPTEAPVLEDGAAPTEATPVVPPTDATPVVPPTDATPTQTAPTETALTQTVPTTPPTAEVVMTAEPALAPVRPRGFGWRVIALTVVGVFVLSLLFVTAVELVAGRPLADLFGGHSKGGSTTIDRIISPGPAPATTTTTSTSSTTTTSTSTTSTTTSTTVPGSTTTSTDNATGSTTTAPDSSSTTTSTSGPG